ncbi:hypothetical protein WJR50_23830 [Catalinimonas sp. 4WD22]|uniref:hypothetical protein n=1 Tax=Catalinimonas locisalis TaxID=3133978 RepID=UPI00310191F7
MLRKIIFILICALHGLACEHESNTVSQSGLRGNWACFDSVLRYTEIYVDGHDIHVHTGTYGNLPSFQYELRNNSIYSIHPESGEHMFVGIRNEKGNFEFDYVDGKITLNHRLSPGESEYSLEKLLKETKASSSRSLYDQYLKDAGIREVAFKKKILSPEAFEYWQHPPANAFDNSFEEIEPVLFTE